LEDRSKLLGTSRAIQEVRKQIETIACSDTTVLISGESGTGKEIAVNLMHQLSNRRTHPLIKVNCAALTESLLESELFGHEKGAFTGASGLKAGRFELAHGGTLFLDEIGELSLGIQTKLLRVLQEKEFERVGGTKTIKTDFRLIAATNRVLARAVELGKFREDLYYRIKVIPLYIPPLRDRRDDIPFLIQHFLTYFCREMGKEIKDFSPEAWDALENYAWPGNVRELKNLAERLAVLVPGKIIGYGDLPEEMSEKNENLTNAELTLQEAKRRFEEDFIKKALAIHGGNVSATARAIGLARKNLQLKMKELGLRHAATIR
jgi:transcriptional regulator with GAF, ATPase, and Fis domain